LHINQPISFQNALVNEYNKRKQKKLAEDAVTEVNRRNIVAQQQQLQQPQEQPQQSQQPQLTQQEQPQLPQQSQQPQPQQSQQPQPQQSQQEQPQLPQQSQQLNDVNARRAADFERFKNLSPAEQVSFNASAIPTNKVPTKNNLADVVSQFPSTIENENIGSGNDERRRNSPLRVRVGRGGGSNTSKYYLKKIKLSNIDTEHIHTPKHIQTPKQVISDIKGGYKTSKYYLKKFE
jgi:outer membrane biosynthesis protein TonB